jgi:hypothetical protein
MVVRVRPRDRRETDKSQRGGERIAPLGLKVTDLKSP